MALFNHATKEVTAKLVYYGPGLCGKTTNLQWIHDNMSFKSKGKLVSLATQADRTLFFDFLPFELGTIRGMRARMQIYTVPGQVTCEATRRNVLKGCDAVIFVADSQAAMLDANAESLSSLRQNLLLNDIDPTIPQVIQYNKRDTATALPTSVLNERLNPRNFHYFEAVALKGTGVEETLTGVTKLLLRGLSRYYDQGTGEAASASTRIAAPGAPAEATLPTPEAPAPPAWPSAPIVRGEEEVPSTIVFAQPPPPQAPARVAEPDVPLFIEDEEGDESALTIVFAKSPPPAPLSTPPPPVAPVVPRALPAAPVPRPEPVDGRLQPAFVRGGAPKPATGPSPPPEMSAPAPVVKAEGKRPASKEGPAAREPEKPTLPSDPPPRGEHLRSDQWLYLLDGAQRGPIDVETLIDLVLTSIPVNTMVWRPGFEGWVLARQVRQIADEIPPPISIPGFARTGYDSEETPDFNTVPPMLRSVLIADEDTAFRKYLAIPLAAQGFRIFEAADGSAAWQLAVQNRPWMILADISMPELDGFEFCRRVRCHPLLSRLPLLLISGSDKYKERYRALQIGADDVLSKKLPVGELMMRMQLQMTRYSDLSASEPVAGTAEVAGAFQGRIEVFGAPALLQMCAQGRLTGLSTALAEDAHKTATVMGFREGAIISATVGATTGAEAVYSFLAWTKGSFEFTPGDPGQGEPLAQSVEHLLLEGCRVLDESNKSSPRDGTAFA